MQDDDLNLHHKDRNMKNKVLLLLFSFIVNVGVAQTITRQNGENRDSLISRVLGDYSLKIGKTYELNDASSFIIIYFEIQVLDSAEIAEINTGGIFYEFMFSPFTGRPTITLFNILYSPDNINYTRYTIDTLDVNSGCCPCHLPDMADSLKVADPETNNNLILYMTHPVRPDCNSVTGHYTLSYSNFTTNIKAGIFAQKPVSRY